MQVDCASDPDPGKRSRLIEENRALHCRLTPDMIDVNRLQRAEQQPIFAENYTH